MSVTVKATFDRWVEDRLQELSLSRDELAVKVGLSPMWLTRTIKDPQKATAETVARFAEVLQLNDWYEELVETWGMGTERATIAEFNDLLKAEGTSVGRLAHVA